MAVVFLAAGGGIKRPEFSCFCLAWRSMRAAASNSASAAKSSSLGSSCGPSSGSGAAVSPGGKRAFSFSINFSVSVGLADGCAACFLAPEAAAALPAGAGFLRSVLFFLPWVRRALLAATRLAVFALSFLVGCTCVFTTAAGAFPPISNGISNVASADVLAGALADEPAVLCARTAVVPTARGACLACPRDFLSISILDPGAVNCSLDT